MFPEFGDLRDHPWNGIRLTAKEHIIAHIMLWKAYGSSQTYALSYMLKITNHKNKTVTASDKIPPVYVVRKYAILRNDLRNWQQRKAKYKDAAGNIFTLKTDDPRIATEGLVGFRRGIKHTALTRSRMLAAGVKRKARRNVTLYFLAATAKVRIDSVKFVEYLEQGWTMQKTSDDIDYTRGLVDAENSKRLTGTMQYTRPDGKYFGRLRSSDPRVAEFSLIPQVTVAQREVGRKHAYMMAEKNVGTTIYNNGTVEVKRKEHPGDGWVVGRLPRSDAHAAAQRDAVRLATAGTTIWNDGARNYRVKPGGTAHPSWIKGMAPRHPK